MPSSIRSGFARPTASVVSSSAASFIDSHGPDVICTRSDVQASLDAYEHLLSSAKQYRNCMMALAKATSDFAASLEECARQKGANGPSSTAGISSNSTARKRSAAAGFGANGLMTEDSYGSDEIDQEAEDRESTSPGEKLMAASALHHLMGNHHQILSDSFYRHFEVPLMDEFDAHRTRVADRQATYEKTTQEKAILIRDTEAKNIKAGKKKQRDLASFRKALVELQNHVNDLDHLKAEHYIEVYESEQEIWDLIATKTALVIRSEVDVFDKIVTKGNSDPVLEFMLQSHEDPFGAYAANDSTTIFSILPPLSNFSQSPSHNLSRTSTPPPLIPTQISASTPTGGQDDTPRLKKVLSIIRDCEEDGKLDSPTSIPESTINETAEEVSETSIDTIEVEEAEGLARNEEDVEERSTRSEASNPAHNEEVVVANNKYSQ